MDQLVAIAATALLLVGAKLAAPVLVPVVLAAVLAIVFQPIGQRVARRGLPPAVTALVTVTAVSAVLALAGAILIIAVSDVAESLPRYREAALAWRDQAAGWLVAHRLDALAGGVAELEPGRYVSAIAADSAATIGAVLQTLALVVLLTVFIQLEAGTFPARLRRVLGSVRRSRESIERTIAALAEIQRYVRVKLVLAVIKASLVGGACGVLGVDQPLLWATLAFCLSFVPVLGPLAASTPPVVVAAVAHGGTTALVLAAILLIINVAFGSLLEPRILGRAVGLSPLVVVLSITLWGFVLGPVGALLAVPLTMIVKIALAESTRLGWLARVLEYRALPALATRRAGGEV
ncbi:MAG: AI-2E family transporter [Kofleriaceae bacterium]